MKKITRNILVISGVIVLSAFTTNKINKLHTNNISIIVSDMIDDICEDVENDRIPRWTAEMYIEELKQIVNKTVDCENCDEID